MWYGPGAGASQRQRDNEEQTKALNALRMRAAEAPAMAWGNPNTNRFKGDLANAEQYNANVRQQDETQAGRDRTYLQSLGDANVQALRNVGGSALESLRNYGGQNEALIKADAEKYGSDQTLAGQGVAADSRRDVAHVTGQYGLGREGLASASRERVADVSAAARERAATITGEFGLKRGEQAANATTTAATINQGGATRRADQQNETTRTGHLMDSLTRLGQKPAGMSVEDVLAYLRAGGVLPQSGSDMVTIEAPTGERRTMPRAQADSHIKRGAKLVQ